MNPITEGAVSYSTMQEVSTKYQFVLIGLLLLSAGFSIYYRTKYYDLKNSLK